MSQGQDNKKRRIRKQIGEAERYQIEALQCAKHSVREIAVQLGMTGAASNGRKRAGWSNRWIICGANEKSISQRSSAKE
jgi:hypothetical protein